MPMPTPVKTWNWDVNNRVTFTTMLTVNQTLLLEMKNYLKTQGFTVKGSSNSVAAAMDAVDRWVVATDIVRGSGTTNVQSWIVLEHAGMGGAEILIAYQGGAVENAKWAWSPGGIWTIAATPTHQPTATDEVSLGTTWDPGTASLDRLWDGWVSTDGAVIMFTIARNNSFERWIGIGMIDSQVVGTGATFSPPIFGFTLSAAQKDVTNFSSLGTNKVARVLTTESVTAVNASCGAGTEGYSSQLQGNRAAYLSKLQRDASGNPTALLMPASVWTETAGVEGKLGNMYDVWSALNTAADGTTYPPTDLDFMQIGDWLVTWDGVTIPVLV